MIDEQQEQSKLIENKKTKKYKLVLIWLPLVIGISIGVGIFIGNVFSNRATSISLWQKGNNKLDNIIDYINKAYVDTINTQKLIEKAIPTVISGLDPHSAYISSEDMQVKGDELEGHFSGIGVEFMLFNDTITIVKVIEGGPSEVAGLKASDRIVKVNDSTFVGEELTNDKVLKRLRGKKDTKVKLSVHRRNLSDLKDVIITRADVPVKSVDVSYMVTKEIGYVKVSRFASTTYDEFISAIAKLKEKGAKALIVDLQGNTGGYMGAAIRLSNEFLSKGDLIVYTEGRTYPREDMFADNTGTFKEEPLVVLVDEGSASASEIFAGAIQDNDRGLIVGRRSFGKGLVQTQHVFPDGSALRLTIARYHTPSGRCIQKKYEVGKGDEYSLDLLNRYKRGEFDNRDSIKTDSLPLYQTIAGREVYGDDGILSDIFVPRDTVGLNSYYLKVVNLGAVKEYTFGYTDKHREKLIDFKSWEKAAKYLENEPLVDELVEYATSQKDIRKRPYLIEESRKLLQNQLEALIIRNIYGDDGFYPVYFKDDKVIKEAISVIEKGYASKEAVGSKLYKNN